MARSPLSYEIVRMNPPQDLRSAARMTCPSCAHTDKIPIVHIGNNPELICQMFTRTGWLVDQHNTSKLRCPSCVQKIKDAKRVQEQSDRQQSSAGARVLPTMNKSSTTPVRTPVRPSSSMEHEGLTLAKLSFEQKADMRSKLDHHFDDKEGQYIDGYSDQQVGEECNIPWKLVFEFRELAYGPIKEDPEIRDFKAALAANAKAISELQQGQQKLLDKLNLIEKKRGL